TCVPIPPDAPVTIAVPGSLKSCCISSPNYVSSNGQSPNWSVSCGARHVTLSKASVWFVTDSMCRRTTRMNKKLIGVFVGLSLGAVGLSACGSGDSDAGSGEDPYRVLVTGGISTEGVLADNSSTSILAAKASVKNINKDGGID